MARLPRYVILGQPQHIIQRGNNRQTIFVAEADYTFFRDALIEAALKHGLRVHTLCGCQSHPFAGPPPRTTKTAWARSSSRWAADTCSIQPYLHPKRHAVGRALPGDRRRQRTVSTERDALIELNPVRAGMAAHPRDYPWSSYGRNALGEAGEYAGWLTPHAEYERLGRDAAERQLFRAAIPRDELATICECTHKGWALEGEGFRAWIDRVGVGGLRRKGRAAQEE